jgi:hypothetical protein
LVPDVVDDREVVFGEVGLLDSFSRRYAVQMLLDRLPSLWSNVMSRKTPFVIYHRRPASVTSRSLMHSKRSSSAGRWPRR